MKILILCALLGTLAHCKPGGYFRQEYQFKKSSATFKNNELQTKDDDQGFYHKQGDLEGPPKVQQHNEQSQYVSPSMGGFGQTVTSYDNRDLTEEAESAFVNHGLAHVPMNSGMGAGGGRSYSSYSSYSSYGTTSSNGQMSQANMQQLKQNLQQELTDCLQEAMSQYRKEATMNSYVTSDSSKIQLLESELKSNITRLLQEALYRNRGSNVHPGSITYTVTATGVYNPQNDINQDLTDIKNQLEQHYLKELRKQVQTIRTESSSHSQTNRRYESAGQTYYDSAEIEDLNRRPNRYTTTNNNMQRRDHSLTYGSSHTYGDQQSTERISYASALNSGRTNKPNFNTHTNVPYQTIHVSINPNVRLTDVMQTIQNNAHKQIMEALRTFEEKYTTSSYRLTNSRPTYDAALNDFKEQLRYNLTDQIQRELEKNYGVQTQMQGYSFSLNAGNTANYKLDDFDNLKKTMENNLNTYLENTLRQQETRYQQQVTMTNVHNRDYTHHGPQFTKGLTESSHNSNIRYQPSSQSQTSYGSNYQTTSQTHNNPELEQLTRTLQSELSSQLLSAIEQQKRQQGNYQTQNSQVLYQELENELRQNITRHLQKTLNERYGNQGSRGGYSYTITSGVYNPHANYQTQDLDTMMKQMQADLERQLREQMTSSGYRQGNYVVVSGGPYVVPNNPDSGLYASSSYPVRVQSPTKSFNKYQQFSTYSHSAGDMNGEDCSQNGHDHGYHQRIRRHTGGYYHQQNVQNYHHRHDDHFGQQQEDLGNLVQQPEDIDMSHFRQPAYYSHHYNGYQSQQQNHRGQEYDFSQPRQFSHYSNSYSSQQQPTHFRQPTYLSHQKPQSHRGEEVLHNLGQQPESLQFNKPPASFSQQSTSYNSPHQNEQGNEQLGQQLEDLDNLGQQQEDVDYLGQQLEELGQQIEDLDGLSQQPQNVDYFELVPDTSRKPNEQLIMTLPKREPVKPVTITKPQTEKPHDDDNFEEVGQQLENLGQQLEEIGFNNEDLSQQTQSEDYFELVPEKPKPQSQANREPAVITPIYTRPQNSQKPAEIGQQLEDDDQQFEDLGQQLEDLNNKNVDSGFGKLQTGKPQSTNFNSRPPKPQSSHQDEELGQVLVELGQQLEDLDNLGQQTDSFGNLDNKNVDNGFGKLQTGKPQSTNFNSRPPKPQSSHQDEELGQVLVELGQQLEDLDNLGQQSDTFGDLGQQLDDLDGLSQQTEDHYGNLETGHHISQQSQDDFGKLETMNFHQNPMYVRSTTSKPKNDEDFVHIEDILANANKPAYVPYRGLNLPRPTTRKPTTSSHDQQQNYNDFQSVDDIYKHEGSSYSHKPNDYNWSSTYVPYRHPSYIPYSELYLDKQSTTPKPIAFSNLYHPDDDTQQITQDIFGHAKPQSTSDDFLDHGDYLQYVGDRKDITHMESMDRLNQQQIPPSGHVTHISQQQQDVYESPRRAISMAEANNMYIRRNQDAHTSRDFNFVRNEQTSPSRNPAPQYRPFQESDLALHKKDDVEDLTQQSEDLGQQLEDLDLTQQSEHFADLHQQSEDFGDLTQQSEDLTQQLEDLTQQTEDLNVEHQHANVGHEPLWPLHTATINEPPRTQIHSGSYGRGSSGSYNPSSPSYGRSLSQQHVEHDGSEYGQHSMPNSEVSSYGRSLVSPKSFDRETSTTEIVDVESVTTEPVGFWKSFGGKVSSSFSSVKQKAKDFMG